MTIHLKNNNHVKIHTKMYMNSCSLSVIFYEWECRCSPVTYGDRHNKQGLGEKKTGHMNMFQSVQSATSNHSILKKMVVRKQKNS